MDTPPPGSIAVIFLSGRTVGDDESYGAAADEMESRAATIDGYLGIDSVRGANGVGVSISWWRDRASAIAWRDDPGHAAIRDRGRDRWYDWYRVVVAEVDRGYDWTRSD